MPLAMRVPRERLFESEHLSADLGRKSIRGAAAMFGAQGSMFVVQMTGTVVLARLLSPDDYGLVAMAAVVLGFAKMFRDAGLSMATVQQDHVTHEQISTLFWVNMAVIVALGLCVAASAPLVARFYGRSELTGITIVLAASFVVNGLSIQHDALLKRHMAFDGVATENVIAQVLNVAGSIGLALAGFGYWAIVAGSCISAVSTTLISFYLCPWLPGRPARGSGVRRMIRFGGHVTGFNFANYFARNMDNILIGRYVGAVGLGLYSKAYNLFMAPLTQVRGPMSDVAMPGLSSLKADPERYRRYYLRLVDTMAMLAVPLAALSLVEADFIIRLLLGPKWLGVVPVFRILATVGLFQAVESTRALVLLSQGQSRKHLNWGVVNSIVMVASFIIGLRWGIVGVASAYAISSYVVALPNLFYSFAGTPVSVPQFLRAFSPSLLCAAAASAAALGTGYATGPDWLLSGVAGTVAFVVVYCALSWSRASVRDNVRLVMEKLRPSVSTEAREAQAQ